MISVTEEQVRRYEKQIHMAADAFKIRCKRSVQNLLLEEFRARAPGTLRPRATVQGGQQRPSVLAQLPRVRAL